MISFALWLWEITAEWVHHESTAPDYANCYGYQPERLFVTVYLGEVDITDGIDSEDWKDINQLCWADKQLVEWDELAIRYENREIAR